MNCLSHHQACPCREHQIAVLHKVALDAAFELNKVSDIIAKVNGEESENLKQIVSRTYQAADALAKRPDPCLAREEETHL